jgi:hypothetical protein
MRRITADFCKTREPQDWARMTKNQPVFRLADIRHHCQIQPDDYELTAAKRNENASQPRDFDWKQHPFGACEQIRPVRSDISRARDH